MNSWRMSLPDHGTMEVVKPNSMHMTARGSEVYYLGDAMYIKPPGQKWMKMPHAAVNKQGQVIDWTRMTREDAAKITATDLGMRSVGGEMMHAYRMTSKNGKQNIVYIARDGYVHRDEGDSPGNTVIISKFNEIGPMRPPI